MSILKDHSLLIKGISLILMLVVPPLLLYPGALGNSALLAVGWIVMLVAMVIPLCVPK